MTTNSVVVTVEGVERIKVTMEGMERWRRSSVHRGGRGAVGDGPHNTVEGVELLETLPHNTVEGVELLETFLNNSHGDRTRQVDEPVRNSVCGA
jgi:hypothetical protein